MQTQSSVEIQIQTEEHSGARCNNCGSSDIHEKRVKSAFWHDERLIVVENIPAAVCEACLEQYFDDGTVVVLDLLRGDGFPEEKARGELRVPIFNFNDRISPPSNA